MRVAAAPDLVKGQQRLATPDARQEVPGQPRRGEQIVVNGRVGDRRRGMGKTTALSRWLASQQVAAWREKPGCLASKVARAALRRPLAGGRGIASHS